MTRRYWAMPVLLLLAGLAWAAPAVDLITLQAPWRAYLVNGLNVSREKGALKVLLGGFKKPVDFDPANPDMAKYFARVPSAAWQTSGFDDRCWPRYAQDDLDDLLGGYGVPVGGWWPSALCLRTSFGVSDPAQVRGLTVAVTCIGGGVVYVNGEEVGRAFLPAGNVALLTPAEDYPLESYTTEDGATPLPAVDEGKKPDAKWLERYQKRIRTFTVDVPAHVLVKGRNVVAVALHRAPTAGPLGRNAWSHLGVRAIAVTSADGAGVLPYEQALMGTRVWSANAEDQVTETPAMSLLSKRGGFKAMIWARGVPIKGTQVGNPFDPVAPVRMVVPRNGVGSGQAVLSDLQGLKGVTASLGALTGPRGAVLPATAATIRYGVQPATQHYCDALMPAPPEGAKTVPVWTIVDVPKDQAPGWYAGTLNLGANGKTFTVPVQVLVTGYTLPDAKDFTSDMGVTQSPDTIARNYKVEPWSDAHFKLLEPSLALMGQLGNDVLHVPVITRNQFGWSAALVHFTKTADGLTPDFTLLERYLDLYAKHCAPPKALCLYIWDANCAKQVARSYEGAQIPSRENTPRMPLMVAVWDPLTKVVTEAEAPQIGDAGSEQFYTRLIGGVRAIVLKRGWSERSILLGMGGDIRPSQEAGALMKQWAPYARWDLLSHFSGDPGSIFNKGNEKLKAGILIAVGGLEVGLKEHPWAGGYSGWTALQFEDRMAHPMDYVDLGTYRWLWQEYSPPFMYRTIPQAWANLGRVGLDFWDPGRGSPQNASYFTAINRITVPGPAGAIPTVRFQMMREGVQDTEVRLSIMRAYAKLPEEQRKPYRALLDELPGRIGSGSAFLSQCELAYDWPAYMAREQAAAAELAGVRSEATWDAPPAP